MTKEKMLRIAMLGQKNINTREGGIEVVVEELSTRMVKKGHDVTCYNRSEKGKRKDSVKKDSMYEGVRLKEVITVYYKGIAAATSSFFAAISCAFGRYDVVHFHAEGPCAMIWLPKLFGKRCIATIHGIDWKREKWQGHIASKYIHFGEKCAVKYADEIIVLSREMQQYFWDTYQRRTVYIPNAIDMPKKRDVKEIRKLWGLESSGYILFLGRLVPEKGLRYLVKAFKHVRTDKKLVIAGGASDSQYFVKELKKLAREDKRIIFTGHVEGNVLEELYSNAYVFTLPSDLEGMSISLLEAMSYGNCCLTSDIAESVEVIEDKGITFRKSDVNDLRDQLQALCDDELIVRRYRQNVAQFVCDKYKWDEVIEDTLKLYRGETD